MKKIPTIFKRDLNNRKLVTEDQNPLCAWVFNGEGKALRKLDGTCCCFIDGKFYKRREVKPNKKTPVGFIEADFDSVTNKRVGWVPVTAEDRWHLEGRDRFGIECGRFDNVTYELVGPKINGNPENAAHHFLIRHDYAQKFDILRDFNYLKGWLQAKDIEGLVFHHDDGRMAKIKKRDFGLAR